MNDRSRIAVLALCLALFSFSSLSSSWLRADLLVFGTDSGEGKELSDLISKNADAINAIEAFRRGDLRTCEQLLNKATKESNDLPRTDVMIARLFLANGQFAEALTRLESYMRTGATDAEAHATFGEIAFQSGRLTDAWLHFNEAMRLSKDAAMNKARRDAFNIQLVRLRAETAEARGDSKTADSLFKELEKLLPKSGYPLWAQGRLLLAKEEIDKGFEMLKKAKTLEKGLPQPELEMAKALAAINYDEKKIEDWFQKGIVQKDSASVMNWFEYLKWLLSKDRPDDVRKLIAKAPAEYQKNRLLRFLNAFALRFLGETAPTAEERAAHHKSAEEAFSILHSEFPTDLEITDQLALILIDSTDQGKKVRAQQLAQANLRRAPNEESAVATAAWVEFKLGSADVANRFLGELMARGPIGPQTAYYVARLFESVGRDAEALNLDDIAVQTPGLFVQRAAIRKSVDLKKKDAAGKIPRGPDKDGKEADAKGDSKAADSKASEAKGGSDPKAASGKGSEPAKGKEAAPKGNNPPSTPPTSPSKADPKAAPAKK